MEQDNRGSWGRIAAAAIVVVALIAVGLYFLRGSPEPSEPVAERAIDRPEPRPVSEPDDGGAPESDGSPRLPTPDTPVPASDQPPERSPPETVETMRPEISLEEAAARLRVQIAERMPRPRLEMLAGDRLPERLVATVHSLDGEPVPLRFRPLAHVPDLPLVDEEADGWRLPDATDPRYSAYREVFDAFSAEELARMFERNEAALERAWRALGEASEGTFRQRVVEVLDHLAGYDLPVERPALTRPEVLYEFEDPELENLSWGRKLLIRIGPEHAPAVQRKAAELADRLARPDSPSFDGG